MNSSTYKFWKEAESFTPLLLNVSCSSETHSVQTQGLYPQCMQVATAFWTYIGSLEDPKLIDICIRQCSANC